MHKCSVSPLCFDWDAVVCEKAWKGKKLASIVCKSALGATVYNIWKHRNNVMFGNRLNSEELNLQYICWEISTRIVGIGKGKFKNS